MKQTICIPTLLLTCILMLTGCRCSHAWDPATCVDAKTCQACGITDGEALGHRWVDATCDAPKTCEICKKTEGKALSHKWTKASCAAAKTCTVCGATEGTLLEHTWIDATCDTPKTCEICKKADGTPLGHSWQAGSCETPQICTVCGAVGGEAPGHIWTDATCNSPKTCSVCNITEGNPTAHHWTPATTEAPKTCTACGKTAGKRIITDSRFKTSECKHLFGSWKSTTVVIKKEPGADHDFKVLEYQIITFKNDGTMVKETGIENFDEYMDYLAHAIEIRTYQELEAKGINKAKADAAMIGTYGMTVKEYARYCVSEYTRDDFITTHKRVYYVKNGHIYGGSSWDHLSPMPYTLKNNKLTLTNGAENVVLTRI